MTNKSKLTFSCVNKICLYVCIEYVAGDQLI